MKELKKIKRVAIFLILLMTVEIFTISFLGNIARNGYEYMLMTKNLTYKSQEILINDVVKKQQELISNQIKQSLINYMTKEDIKIATDNKWNMKDLNQVLNIAVEPIKIFGNKGGIIVFDSKSGQVFLNTSTLGEAENIKDHKLIKPFVLEIMEKKDTVSDKHIILSEKINCENTDNYKDYPLGLYDRSFVDKVILPFETFGFSGDRQLTVLTVANENDIFSSFVSEKEEFEKKTKELENKTAFYICIIFLMLIFTVILVLWILHRIRIQQSK